MENKEKKNKKIVSRFTKYQITNSKKYKSRRDLLNAILDDNKQYTTDEVDSLIYAFMKGDVK